MTEFMTLKSKLRLYKHKSTKKNKGIGKIKQKGKMKARNLDLSLKILMI